MKKTMKKIRIIPRLDVKGENVVKGIQLEGLRVVGKPEELAAKYCREGADELIYMDVVASLYSRDSLLHIVEKATETDVFVPVTVGGGIRSLEDINKTLRAGADKVAINTAAIKNPELLKTASRMFGSSTIVLSVEAKKISDGKWEAYIDNGREKTGRDVIDWVKEAIKLGAGEVFLTSIDHDGMRKGFDLELIRAVSEISTVPVIASGGAGTIEQIEECIKNSNIDGVSLASQLHYNKISLAALREELFKKFGGRIKVKHAKNINLNYNNTASVSIIDYGLGNLRSVKNAFQKIGAKVEFVTTPEGILNSELLVLPGVGSFEEGMRNLKRNNLNLAIINYALSKKPILGICLGMQLFMTKSYEFGTHQGLNIIEGEVLPFNENLSIAKEGYKIPHVGWNSVSVSTSQEDSILSNLDANEDAYFVHSFFVKPQNKENILATTEYFGQEFSSAVRKGNVFGCQFHPEKSGNMGLSILSDFIKLNKKESLLNA